MKGGVMAKFELELTRREKRILIGIIGPINSDYKKYLHAVEREQISFESEYAKTELVEKTKRASTVLSKVMKQLHDQEPC
jgi:hypothetical protein